jgi:8-oxo-dGTP pyrophosphatase MutT (NUDIX family)
VPHIHTEPGQVDHTVEVFVVDLGRVLLRLHDKFGIWLSVGGHIELDEDPVQAALREVKEEVGLDVELVGGLAPPDYGEPGYAELTPPVFMNRVRITDTHDHVTYTYYGRIKAGEVVTENPKDEVRWFSRDDLERNAFGLKQSIRHYALCALDALDRSSAL